MLGALEHQVLEEMRKARAIFRFDAKADPIHHFHDDDRRRVVLADDDPKAIGQRARDNGNRKGGAAGNGLRGETRRRNKREAER